MAEKKYTTLSEYIKMQKEIGSCSEHFKKSLKNGFKAGLLIGTVFSVFSIYK